MKLTIEHLSCYLPYGLKVLTTKRGDFNRPDYTLISEWTAADIMQPFHKRYQVKSCKPILRPMSDLDKVMPEILKSLSKIDLSIATFESMYDEDSDVWWVNASLGWSVVCSLQFDGNLFSIYYKGDKADFEIYNPQYEAVKELAKHKIDYQDLIELGLAISIHDVEGEVY